MELPMIFGIKSFCCESLSNKLNNPELIEIVADFYRFIDYTGLENFIPEAKSIDYMGVIRDRNAFVNDIKKGKFRYLPIKMSEFESRCKNISSIKNMPLNIVVNRFAVAKNLNRYKIVFLPSDKVLDNKLATELLEYVKNGGCLITEGCSINNSLLAKAAGVRKVDESDYKTSKLIIKDKEEENVFAGRCFASLRAVEDSARIIGVDDQSRPSLFLKDYGKGKIIYSTYFLSDDLSKDCNKADFVRKLIRDRAGLPPVKVPSDYINILDTNLLADKNKYMLGVYNSSQSKKAECSLELNMKPAKEMYVLDLKNSRRTKFDGTIKVSIPPEKTGFFLIGDDSFTKIPEAKELPANNGYATVSGMTFHNLNNKYKYKIPSKEEIQVIGIFKPAKEKKPKSSSQNFGYKAIFDCLSEPGLKNISVKYLDDLSRKSLDGCNILIVPNIGLQRPKNLKPDWPENVREFVKQGGGAIILHHAVTDYNPFPEIASGTGTYNPAKTIRITAEHPLTKGLETGNTFQDTCWDYKELLPGKDGKVFLKGVPEKDWPAPVGVAGKVGKGKVLISGLGIGAGYRKNGHKTEKFEITPTGKLKKILINAVAWLTE
jgi:hypothetical protein